MKPPKFKVRMNKNKICNVAKKKYVVELERNSYF